MDGWKNMDTNKMCYLAGLRVGIETLMQVLSDVANKNGNQLPVEFINCAANKIVSDIETQLKSMECGDEFVDMLDSE